MDSNDGRVGARIPPLADDTVYVGSWDSFFYALDATTGKEKWRYKTGEDHDIYTRWASSPPPVVANACLLRLPGFERVCAECAHLTIMEILEQGFV